jgi:hypothetical protein
MVKDCNLDAALGYTAYTNIKGISHGAFSLLRHLTFFRQFRSFIRDFKQKYCFSSHSISSKLHRAESLRR